MKLVKTALKLLARPIGYLAVFLLRFAGRLNLKVSEKCLVGSHLLRSGSPLHPNKAIFIRTLSEFGHLPLQVVETGTSAWGADSTRLWDEYVRIAGGLVLTVDIRPDPSLLLQNKVSKSTESFVGTISTERGKGVKALSAIADDPRFEILNHEYAVAIKRIS